MRERFLIPACLPSVLVAAAAFPSAFGARARVYAHLRSLTHAALLLSLTHAPQRTLKDAETRNRLQLDSTRAGHAGHKTWPRLKRIASSSFPFPLTPFSALTRVPCSLPPHPAPSPTSPLPLAVSPRFPLPLLPNSAAALFFVRLCILRAVELRPENCSRKRERGRKQNEKGGDVCRYSGISRSKNVLRPVSRTPLVIRITYTTVDLTRVCV